MKKKETTSKFKTLYIKGHNPQSEKATNPMGEYILYIYIRFGTILYKDSLYKIVI